MLRAALLVGSLLVGLAPGLSSSAPPQRESLSEYFVIDRVRGGFRKGSHVDIYVRNPDGKLEYIGSTSDPGWMGDPQRLGVYGAHLEETVFAVSQDGRAIVFRHFPELAKRGFRQEAGIYRYEYGKGTELLHKGDELGRSWKAWPKPLPKNVLVFQGPLKSLDDPPRVQALTAEGEEFPIALLGATPLHRAAYEDRLEEAVELLAKNEEINARTHWAFTPLDVAIVRGHDQIAILLVERGASLTAGEYPSFHLAVSFWRVGVLEAMWKRGIDLNAPDPRGTPPLYLAVEFYPVAHTGEIFGLLAPLVRDPRQELSSVPPVLEWLVDHGAHLEGKNKEGKTALDVLSVRPTTIRWYETAREFLVSRSAQSSPKN